MEKFRLSELLEKLSCTIESGTASSFQVVDSLQTQTRPRDQSICMEIAHILLGV